MKLFQMIQEIVSRRESVMDGLTDGRMYGLTDKMKVIPIISTPLRDRGLKWLMGQSYNCVALKNGCPFFPSIQVIYLFYLHVYLYNI